MAQSDESNFLNFIAHAQTVTVLDDPKGRIVGPSRGCIPQTKWSLAPGWSLVTRM
jgi:hypothetical protein